MKYFHLAGHARYMVFKNFFKNAIYLVASGVALFVNTIKFEMITSVFCTVFSILTFILMLKCLLFQINGFCLTNIASN